MKYSLPIFRPAIHMLNYNVPGFIRNSNNLQTLMKCNTRYLYMIPFLLILAHFQGFSQSIPGTVPNDSSFVTDKSKQSRNAATLAQGLDAVEPQLVGKYEITAAAKGSLSQSYTITLNKPAGATTAYKIYMYKAGTMFPAGATNNLIIDGSSYSFANSRTSESSPGGSFATTFYGEVSNNTVLKNKLDNAAAGGDINISINESTETLLVDGVGIIVIWNTPSKPAGSFFVILGAALSKVAGYTKGIATNPIDLTNPDLKPILGIGISYSNTPQSTQQNSRLTVNGNIITENAGAYDDGAGGTNGALITLGGYGDDPDNNDSDELYNIKNQLINGANYLNFTFTDVAAPEDDVINAIYFSGVGICSSPDITGITPASQTVNQNAIPAGITVTATSTGALSYQWYSSTTNNNSGGTIISGATNATYTPTTNTLGTTYYYVVVSNGGCNSTSGTVVRVDVVNACNANAGTITRQ